MPILRDQVTSVRLFLFGSPLGSGFSCLFCVSLFRFPFWVPFFAFPLGFPFNLGLGLLSGLGGLGSLVSPIVPSRRSSSAAGACKAKSAEVMSGFGFKASGSGWSVAQSDVGFRVWGGPWPRQRLGKVATSRFRV